MGAPEETPALPPFLTRISNVEQPARSASHSDAGGGISKSEGSELQPSEFLVRYSTFILEAAASFIRRST
jgi:hypothetical protein